MVIPIRVSLVQNHLATNSVLESALHPFSLLKVKCLLVEAIELIQKKGSKSLILFSNDDEIVTLLFIPNKIWYKKLRTNG